MAHQIQVPANASMLRVTINPDTSRFQFWAWSAFHWPTAQGPTGSPPFDSAGGLDQRTALTLNVNKLKSNSIGIAVTRRDSTTGPWSPTVTLQFDTDKAASEYAPEAGFQTDILAGIAFNFA